MTEDSDLVPFGATRLLLKMDDQGAGTLFHSANLFRALVSDPARFQFDKLRRVCILAGCDYLPVGLPGVGLAKARVFFAKVSNPDLRRTLKRIPLYLNMKKLSVSNAFVESFIQAENTFLYQTVFDVQTRSQRPLNDYPVVDGSQLGPADFPYAGKPTATQGQVRISWYLRSSDVLDLLRARLSSEGYVNVQARELSLGNLDPMTLQRLDSFLPSLDDTWSIWHPDYKPGQHLHNHSPSSRHPKAVSTAFQSVKLDKRTTPASQPARHSPRKAAKGADSVDVSSPSLSNPIGSKAMTDLRTRFCPSTVIDFPPPAVSPSSQKAVQVGTSIHPLVCLPSPHFSARKAASMGAPRGRISHYFAPKQVP